MSKKKLEASIKNNKESKKKNLKKESKTVKQNSINKNKKIITIFIILAMVVLCFIGLLVYILIINKEYTVSFDSDGGSVVKTIKTNNKGSLVFPTEKPMKDGYIFNGWQLNDKFLIQGTIIDKNIEVKASWVDVGYNYIHVVYSAGDGFNDIDILVEKNQRAVKPNDPVAKDKEFKGWYLNNSEFDFDARINDNIILIAKWDEKTPNDKDNKCINSSFVLKDDQCVKTISLEPIIEYYCDDDWELVGKNCVKPDLTGNSMPATPVYMCNSDYKLNGNKCEKQLTATPSSVYKCNSGVLEGTICYKYEERYVITHGTSGYSKEKLEEIYADVARRCSSWKGRMEITGSQYRCAVTEKKANGNAQLVYNCPSGYNLSNGVCYKNSIINAIVKNYLCDDGYLLVGDKCYEKSNTIQKEEAKSELKCYDDFELKDEKCKSNITLAKVK